MNAKTRIRRSLLQIRILIAQKSFHKIRKTVLTDILESKQFSTKEVQLIAGHKDIATTENYYHFINTDTMSESVKLSNVLKSLNRSDFATPCNTLKKA